MWRDSIVTRCGCVKTSDASSQTSQHSLWSLLSSSSLALPHLPFLSLTFTLPRLASPTCAGLFPTLPQISVPKPVLLAHGSEMHGRNYMMKAHTHTHRQTLLYERGDVTTSIIEIYIFIYPLPVHRLHTHTHTYTHKGRERKCYKDRFYLYTSVFRTTPYQ